MAPKCTPDIGNSPAYNKHRSLAGVLYFLNSCKCKFAAANHQANGLPKSRIKRITSLKHVNPKSHPVNMAQRISENLENFRVIAESHANTLNFDCISQQGQESDRGGVWG